MSWDKLDVSHPDYDAKAKELEAKERELCKAYFRCFNTDEGKKVFEHLNQHFIYGQSISHNQQNIEYVAGYNNGQADLVKYILHKMQRAKTL